MPVQLNTLSPSPAFPAHMAQSIALPAQFDLAAASKALSVKAAEALKAEAWIAPKPGLVDRFGSGSHSDMDLSTFCRSAEAVSPYFGRMYECGFAASQRREAAPRAVFEQARRIGVQAEVAMYAATGGVNTHKGAIFTFGLLSTALGYLSGKGSGSTFYPDQLLQCAAEMVQGIVQRELSADSRLPDAEAHNTADMKETAGERLFKSWGLTGIRGEAERAYPSVLLYGLPALEPVRRGTASLDQAGVQALLHLMTVVEDSNVAARGGIPGLLYVQESAEQALSLGGAYTAAGRSFLQQMNSEFVSRNISPGGSADLLSASLYIDSLFTI